MEQDDDPTMMKPALDLGKLNLSLCSTPALLHDLGKDTKGSPASQERYENKYIINSEALWWGPKKVHKFSPLRKGAWKALLYLTLHTDTISQQEYIYVSFLSQFWEWIK